jgi:hypothetical protein
MKIQTEATNPKIANSLFHRILLRKAHAHPVLKTCGNIHLLNGFGSKRTVCSKGEGTSVDLLHLFDSFPQKCSKLGMYTTQDLKNNFYFRGFSISSGPEPHI